MHPQTLNRLPSYELRVRLLSILHLPGSKACTAPILFTGTVLFTAPILFIFAPILFIFAPILFIGYYFVYTF